MMAILNNKKPWLKSTKFGSNIEQNCPSNYLIDNIIYLLEIDYFILVKYITTADSQIYCSI